MLLPARSFSISLLLAIGCATASPEPPTEAAPDEPVILHTMEPGDHFVVNINLRSNSENVLTHSKDIYGFSADVYVDRVRDGATHAHADVHTSWDQKQTWELSFDPRGRVLGMPRLRDPSLETEHTRRIAAMLADAGSALGEEGSRPLAVDAAGEGRVRVATESATTQTVHAWIGDEKVVRWSEHTTMEYSVEEPLLLNVHRQALGEGAGYTIDYEFSAEWSRWSLPTCGTMDVQEAMSLY